MQVVNHIPSLLENGALKPGVEASIEDGSAEFDAASGPDEPLDGISVTGDILGHGSATIVIKVRECALLFGLVRQENHM